MESKRRSSFLFCIMFFQKVASTFWHDAIKARAGNLPAPWIKWLTLWHRWAGVVLCLMFCVWFATGAVMVFVPFPALDPADRDAHAASIDFGQVKIAPTAILTGDPNAHLHLVNVLGKPAYIKEGAHDRAIDAATGLPLAPLAPEQARTIAEQFAHAAASHVSAPLAYDQWVVHQQFDRLRPFYRVELDDPARTDLYVSRATGEVAQKTTRPQRLWNWAGSVIHWIYITPIRKSFSLWDQLVWWISLAGLLLTIAGVTLGVIRSSKALRNVKRPRLTPFRGWLEWHHKIGLFAGILVLMWIFSGWLSMDHGRLFSTGATPDAKLTLYQGATLAEGLRTVTPQDLQRLSGFSRVDFNVVAGHPVIAGSGPKGASLIDRPVLLAGLKDAFGQAAPRTLSQVALTGTYALAEGFGGPVWLGHLGDPGHTDIYINGSNGRILVMMNTSRAAYAWLYYAVHTWNWPFLATHPVLHHALVLLLLAVGLGFSVTSLTVALKRLRLTFNV